jgi:hypothetical protein
MMGPESSESSSECCLLEVSTIPHFSYVFNEIVDECCYFSIISIGPRSGDVQGLAQLKSLGLGYNTGTGTGLNNCTFGYTTPVFSVSQFVTGMT